MKKYILIIFSLLTILISEDKTYEFTEDEVKIFHTSINELEEKDSLNVLIINGLKNQIFDFETIIKNDSLIIQQLEFKSKLQSELIELVKPKWYDNKYLWFFGGFFSFYMATKAVDSLN